MSTRLRSRPASEDMLINQELYLAVQKPAQAETADTLPLSESGEEPASAAAALQAESQAQGHKQVGMAKGGGAEGPRRVSWAPGKEDCCMPSAAYLLCSSQGQ